MRIGMIPSPTGDEWERLANPHLVKLSEALSELGWQIVPLVRDGTSATDDLGKRQLSLIWVHWPSVLYDVRRASCMGFWTELQRKFRANAAASGWKFLWQTAEKVAAVCKTVGLMIRAPIAINRSIEWLLSGNCPVVWEIHDIGSHHIIGEKKLDQFDRLLHNELYRVSSGIVIHEQSCLGHIVERFGSVKPWTVAELGPYRYGEPVSKNEARTRLGISGSGKVLSYLGTARQNRNPLAAVDAFLKTAGNDDYLLVAGMGVAICLQLHQMDQRLLVYDGMIPPAKYRDLLCASDFVINDGECYLTSAVVRAAMSYGVPVIVRPYGSAIDMARGAAILIGHEGVAGAIFKALHIDQHKYQGLQAAARLRDSERSWELSGRKLDSFFRQTLVSGRRS